MQVGNAYVNKKTTGAVVRRQPFGGWKRSTVGPTAKAGGFRHAARVRHVDARRGAGTWTRRARRFLRAWREWFSREHDDAGMTFEANVLRYRPLDRVLVRVGSDTPDGALRVAALAARTCGVRLEVSSPSPLPDGVPGGTSGARVVVEDDAALAARVPIAGADRLRALTGVGGGVLRAAHAADVTVDVAPVTAHGRVELRHWLREQSISRTLHRYGTIVAGQRLPPVDPAVAGAP